MSRGLTNNTEDPIWYPTELLESLRQHGQREAGVGRDLLGFGGVAGAENNQGAARGIMKYRNFCSVGF